MKKWICLTLAVLFVLCLSIPAFAASDSTVSLTASQITLKRGDTFTVTAWLSGRRNAALGTVKLDFDTNIFTLTGGTCHIPNTNLGKVVPSKKAGTFLLTDEPQRIGGNLFTFELTVSSTAPLGSHTISSIAALGESTGSSIPSGKITVTVTDGCDHVFDGGNCSFCHCPKAPETVAVDRDTVTLKSVKDHQYSIDGLHWQDSPTFTGLLPNTPYRFYLRYKDSSGTVSPAGEGQTVRTLASAGDLNGDDGVDNDDVLHLLWRLLFGDDYPLYTNGDVNHDSTLNNDDVLYLLWHILFGDSYPIH